MELTSLQTKAIKLRTQLTDAGTIPSVKQVMAETGKSESLWYYWLEDPKFRAVLFARQDNQIAAKVRKRLHQAVDTLGIDKVIQLYLAEKPRKVEYEDKTPKADPIDEELQRLTQEIAARRSSTRSDTKEPVR